MASRWTLEVAHATDPGKVRSNNEDSLAVDAARRYAVLADGMGGHNAGEVASRIAVGTVEAGMRALAGVPEHRSSAEVESLLVRQVLAANSAIYRAAEGHAAYSGMGTTLVLALWHEAGVSVAHVGDSRLYRLRGRTLEPMTRDHSVIQEQIDLGLLTREEARHSPARNLVTRALGLAPEVDVDVHTDETRPGDLYLLCSDGLTDMVGDSDLTGLLAQNAGLDAVAYALVQRANANGGRDNISVILVRLRAPAAP